MDLGTTSGVLFFVIAILSLLSVSWFFFGDSPQIQQIQKTQQTHQNNQYNKIPKRIWTYQDSETPTRLQSYCYNTWRTYHPDYTIQILTPSNYKGYINIPERQSVPLWRDRERWEEALCLYTLEEHGGLWLDSRTQLRGSVDDWLFPRYGEVSGFYWKQYTTNTDKDRNRDIDKSPNPFIDRRCIACNKNSVFIQRWKAETERLLGHPSVDSYLRSIFTTTPLDQFTTPQEWLMSFSLQHELLQRPYPMESILLQPVEEGPMAHYEKGDKKKALAIGLQSVRPIVFLEE